MPLIHGVTILSADLYPGGWPRLEVASVATVMVAGPTNGRAVASSSSVTVLIRGEYVDVARSFTATTDCGTEALNEYAGVGRVGVGTTKFGKVVGTVSEREEKRAESDAGDKGTADGDWSE